MSPHEPLRGPLLRAGFVPKSLGRCGLSAGHVCEPGPAVVPRVRAVPFLVSVTRGTLRGPGQYTQILEFFIQHPFLLPGGSLQGSPQAGLKHLCFLHLRCVRKEPGGPPASPHRWVQFC